MQPDKRVIRRSEQVGRDRKPVFVDQPVPFLRCAIEEQSTKRDSEQPESKESEFNAAGQTLRGQVNGQAAGQQANRVEDRRFEDFERSRPRQALTRVKEIGYDKDRKDRGFGDDETGHRHFPARWQLPLSCRVRK